MQKINLDDCIKAQAEDGSTLLLTREEKEIGIIRSEIAKTLGSQISCNRSQEEEK